MLTQSAGVHVHADLTQAQRTRKGECVPDGAGFAHRSAHDHAAERTQRFGKCVQSLRFHAVVVGKQNCTHRDRELGIRVSGLGYREPLRDRADCASRSG